MKILITGITGSLGQEIVRRLLSKSTTNRIVGYCRNEQKQVEMAKRFPMIELIVGDIRDLDRLRSATRGSDAVIHLAAMKHVDIAHDNPEECTSVNVRGVESVSYSCFAEGVKKAIMMSSDKAVYPESVYGATKLIGERIWLKGSGIGTIYAVVRSGNMIGSSGSVIPYWKKLAAEGQNLPVTHPDMERYFVTLEDVADFIIDKLDTMRGGEIFIPKCRKRRMVDVAQEIIRESGKDIKIEYVGLRPGERLTEDLLTKAEEEKCERVIHV
jgi:UDP-N-acetylglucosamine 4,6-dehydratase